jgi:hypothetical protein
MCSSFFLHTLRLFIGALGFAHCGIILAFGFQLEAETIFVYLGLVHNL